MKEDVILGVIHRKLTGEISTEEQVWLSEWLSASPENQAYFIDIEKSWELSLSSENRYEPDVKAGLSKLQARIASDKLTSEKTPDAKIKPLTLFFRVAAVLLVAAGIGYLVNPFVNNSASAEQYTTSIDETLVVQLTDGSVVWMQENSTLTLDRAFNSNGRKVTFSGNALFDITPSALQPFHIDGGPTDILVLGTKFVYNTLSTGSSGFVQVVEGKVQFSLDATNEILILTANEAGNISDNASLSKIPLSEKPFVSETNTIVFKNVVLSKVVNVLEQQYGIQFNWDAESEVLACGFVSNFRNAELSVVLETLETAFNMDIEQTGASTYTLIGGSCLNK